MTDNIFGQRFLGRREPAWHKLGDTFDEPMTTTQALVRVDGMYEVVKVPIILEAFGRKVNTNRYALVREPVKGDDRCRYFGEVSNSYEGISTRRLAEMMDPISEKWPVETVGCLGYGETLFITLDAGTIDIAGEEVHQYFLATDNKAAGGRLRFAVEPERVVCRNTLNAGLAQALVTTQITHLTGANAQMEWHLKMIERMEFALDKVVEAMRTLAKTNISRETAMQIIEESYPEPRKDEMVKLFEEVSAILARTPVQQYDSEMMRMWDQQKETEAVANRYQQALSRMESYRAGAVFCYDKLCDEFPKIAGTGWAIYNAIVETEDYRDGGNDIVAAQSAIFGDRARTKERAFASAMSYTK